MWVSLEIFKNLYFDFALVWREHWTVKLNRETEVTNDLGTYLNFDVHLDDNKGHTLWWLFFQMRSNFVSFFTDQDVPPVTKGCLPEPVCLWPGFVVYYVSGELRLGTIHLKRQHLLGGEWSKLCQICRRILVKNCRR